MASTAHRAIDRAREEASAQGARCVEAEHLLLALTSEPEVAALLDEQTVRRALQQEWVAGLRAAGVTQDVPAPGAPDPKPPKPPKPGESMKVALVRGVAVAKVHHARRMRAVHLLHGVLSAERGTVPRALALAGLDRTALRDEAERAF